MFDCLYNFLNNTNLISKNQSGFRPADSTINQLLSITSNIYESFESSDETPAVFLNISKAFDKVWHKGLTFKLQCNCISGNLLSFLESYLNDRHQRVLKSVKWCSVKLGKVVCWYASRVCTWTSSISCLHK